MASKPHPYVTDLRFAMSTGVAVDITTRAGATFFTGVRDVDDEHFIVTLANPQHFGDSTTTRKLNIGDITALAVTDVSY